MEKSSIKLDQELLPGNFCLVFYLYREIKSFGWTKQPHSDKDFTHLEISFLICQKLFKMALIHWSRWHNFRKECKTETKLLVFYLTIHNMNKTKILIKWLERTYYERCKNSIFSETIKFNCTCSKCFTCGQKKTQTGATNKEWVTSSDLSL
jgi:hypothetical protein